FDPRAQHANERFRWFAFKGCSRVDAVVNLALIDVSLIPALSTPTNGFDGLPLKVAAGSTP
ncbi:hypothetical protein C5706_33345, partial [Klebsiella pneumoniae]